MKTDLPPPPYCEQLSPVFIHRVFRCYYSEFFDNYIKTFNSFNKKINTFNSLASSAAAYLVPGLIMLFFVGTEENDRTPAMKDFIALKLYHAWCRPSCYKSKEIVIRSIYLYPGYSGDFRVDAGFSSKIMLSTVDDINYDGNPGTAH